MQAVGAEQVAISEAGLVQLEVGFEVGTAQRLQQQRSLRVRGGFAGRDLTLVQQLLNQGVVMGDLEHLTVADQVGPGVADVDESQLRTGPQQGRQRCTHAEE